MKRRYSADVIFLGVVHEMAAVCRHCVTVFNDSDPVVNRTPDDHKCMFDRTATSACIHAVDILGLHLNRCVIEPGDFLFFCRCLKPRDQRGRRVPPTLPN